MNKKHKYILRTSKDLFKREVNYIWKRNKKRRHTDGSLILPQLIHSSNTHNDWYKARPILAARNPIQTFHKGRGFPTAGAITCCLQGYKENQEAELGLEPKYSELQMSLRRLNLYAKWASLSWTAHPIPQSQLAMNTCSDQACGGAKAGSRSPIGVSVASSVTSQGLN